MDMGEAEQRNIENELKDIFKPFDLRIHPEKYRLDYPEGILRNASILIPVCVINGEYHLILTVRSEKLSHHAGFVAFPGGMQDDTDIDNVHTALREAKEEIGLEPDDVKVICAVTPGLIMPNTLVTPIVGLVPSDFKPVINEHEVSLVFKLPLKRFLSLDGRKILEFYSGPEKDYVFHTHHFVDNINGKEVDTWGYTGMLCVLVALVIYQSDQSFCFYQNYIIRKENAFDPSPVREIINWTIKIASKY